jgi:hypothetical protein
MTNLSTACNDMTLSWVLVVPVDTKRWHAKRTGAWIRPQRVAAMVEPAINKVLWVSFTSRTAPGSTDGSVASILQQGLEVRYKK